MNTMRQSLNRGGENCRRPVTRTAPSNCLRAEAEAMLGEMATVLRFTERVKISINESRECPVMDF